jgi:N6-L-threonylcarbamoyladenine synthase
MKNATILGIESSCDDTAAAVLKNGNILANVIANQSVHEAYGGVVPELASRAHQANIIPVVQQAMEQAGIAVSELDAIAFTRGPGLIGPLLVGTMFAKGLALARQIPLIEVHHMHAHIVAHLIDEPKPTFPFLCLTVSGGHTQIVKVNDYLSFELIGTTLDDAAGEAFDKTGKLLGLPYPAGPVIDKLAKEGDPNAFSFPEPSIPGLDFSFSGLKTAILYFLQENEAKDADFKEKRINDVCASVQDRIVSILMNKLEKAAEQTGIDQVAIAGGVSANSGLRGALEEKGKERGWQTFIPAFEYCTDNAAMIAMTGFLKFQEAEFAEQDTAPLARMPV